MKALILAGGRGKRLDELSKNKNKCMIEVHGRPVIEYSLDNAASTDVDEILLVVGYRAEEIINNYGISYKGKRLRYVLQWEQKGLVHAMECASEALAGDDFMLLLGDEIMLNPRHAELITSYKSSNAFAVCGVLQVEDCELIRRTYTLIQDENRVIHRLVEKPRKPFNNLMGTGDCVFNNRILDYISVTPIHHERQERELPDLIQCAIDDGMRVVSFDVCDRYANINSCDDIVFSEANL